MTQHGEYPGSRFPFNARFERMILTALVREPAEVITFLEAQYFSKPIFQTIARIAKFEYSDCKQKNMRLSRNTLSTLVETHLGQKRSELWPVYKKEIRAIYDADLSDLPAVVGTARQFAQDCVYRNAVIEAEEKINAGQFDDAVGIMIAARDKFLRTGSLRGFGRFIDFPGPAELAELPDSEWWIEGLITDAGVTLISGRPDSCKSWLNLLFARCSVHGLPFMGRPVQRRWVLYVDAENGRSVMKERCDILNITGTRMRFWCLDEPEGAPPPLDSPIYFDLAKKYRPVFIFDPLREFFSGADKGETNIESALLPTLRAAKQLAHRCRVPVILIHHSSDKDSRNTYLHSTHIRGAIDASYFIREKKADPTTPHLHVLRVKSMKARRAEKVSFNITLNLHTGEFDETCSSDKQKLSDAAERIKRLLQKHPQISQRKIAEKLDITRWLVQKVFSSAS